MDPFIPFQSIAELRIVKSWLYQDRIGFLLEAENHKVCSHLSELHLRTSHQTIDPDLDF